jgi:hypothetical protein
MLYIYIHIYVCVCVLDSDRRQSVALWLHKGKLALCLPVGHTVFAEAERLMKDIGYASSY